MHTYGLSSLIRNGGQLSLCFDSIVLPHVYAGRHLKINLLSAVGRNDLCLLRREGGRLVDL